MNNSHINIDSVLNGLLNDYLNYSDSSDDNNNNIDYNEIMREYSNVMNSYNENIRIYHQNVAMLLNNDLNIRLNSRSGPVHSTNRSSSTQPSFSTRNNTRSSTTNNTQSTSSTTSSSTNTFRNNRFRQRNSSSRTNSTIPTQLFYYTNLYTSPEETAESTRLTPEEIQSSTSIINYDNTMNETRCPISFEDFTEGEEIYKINQCGHIFKKTPLENWFSRSNNCPVCRYNLRETQNENSTAAGNTYTRPTPSTPSTTLRAEYTIQPILSRDRDNDLLNLISDTLFNIPNFNRNTH